MTEKPTAGQNAYRPYGGARAFLYDRSPIVGISGPAGTGKSRLALEKVHLLCEKYPGARYLLLRKTRESLSEAALFTYETRVLPAGHPALDGPQRSHRQVYRYPNGSEIHIVGLDKPQKVMSTEFDGAYIQEAIECEQSDIEMVTTRLRNGVIPYQQLIFDCNPDKPRHFIKLGSVQGKWPLYESHHEDNPTLWEEAPRLVQEATSPTQEWPALAPDGRIGRWTKGGIDYIAKLDALTGARRQRLRHGLWVSAEGAIYEVPDKAWFSPAEKWPLTDGVPPHSWRRIWSVDFGFVHPMVICKFAIDPDGRAWQYWELYHTRMMVKDCARAAVRASGWERLDGEIVQVEENAEPMPTDIVCDWDAEGRATLEDELGIRTTPAYKGISDGIEAVGTRLRDRADGQPGLMLARNCVVDPDIELIDAKKPASSQEEWDGYVWDEKSGRRKGELPLGLDDHGMDTQRYFVTFLDGIRANYRAKDVALGDAKFMPVAAVPQKKPDRSMGGMLIGGKSSRSF